MRRCRQRGSFTVEFALVVPVLFAIMFGIIDTGRYVATRTILEQAAAIGARTMCLGSATQSNVDTAVRDSAPGVSISVDWTNSNCQDSAGVAEACNVLPKSAGETVNVRVQYAFVPAFFTSLRKTMTNDSRLVCN